MLDFGKSNSGPGLFVRVRRFVTAEKTRIGIRATRWTLTFISQRNKKLDLGKSNSRRVRNRTTYFHS
jgi:hypothetical protein